jgi:hypothetical protein
MSQTYMAEEENLGLGHLIYGRRKGVSERERENGMVKVEMEIKRSFEFMRY